MPTPAERDELTRLQLRDLRDRRRNATERRWLWFIVAVLLAIGLKYSGLI